MKDVRCQDLGAVRYGVEGLRNHRLKSPTSYIFVVAHGLLIAHLSVVTVRGFVRVCSSVIVDKLYRSRIFAAWLLYCNPSRDGIQIGTCGLVTGLWN